VSTVQKEKILNCELSSQFKINRTLLNGHYYIGVGYPYTMGFLQQAAYHLTTPDGDNIVYKLPGNHPNALSLEMGWDFNKIRYAVSGSYLNTSPFPRDHSLTIENQEFMPFANMNPNNFMLNFEVAFRLWGHWRNGIKI
jgi:hypothetical protein